MALLPIVQYPDPVLRARCRAVDQFDQELERLVADMIETLYAAPGIGLAASQVGIERRVAVIDLSAGVHSDEVLVLVNPVIGAREGLEVETEGCLSIPDYTDKVARSSRLELRAFDARGEPWEITAEGLLARAIQHEIDHLDGVLFVDHLVGLRRDRARRHLRRLAEDRDAAATGAEGVVG